MKQRILQSAFILTLTIGFPSGAAFLTREVFVPRPTDTSQDDTPGIVISDGGDSSASGGSSNPTDEGQNDQVIVPSPQAQAQEIHFNSGSSAAANSAPSNSSASVNPTSSVPEGGFGGDTSEPAPISGNDPVIGPIPEPETEPQPEPDPDPASPPDPDPILSVDANVLDVVEAEAEAGTGGLSVDVVVTP